MTYQRLDASIYRERLRYRAAARQAKPKAAKRSPVIHVPRGPEEAYVANVRRTVRGLQKIVASDLDIERVVREVRYYRPDDMRHLDAYDDVLAKLLDTIRVIFGRNYPDSYLEETARQAALDLQAGNKKAVSRMFRALIGIDVIGVEPWLGTEMSIFVTQNVNLIKTLHRDTFNTIEQIVLNGARSGLRHEAIAKQLLGTVTTGRKNPFDNAVKRAEFIARDQMNKFNGQLSMLRQMDAGGEEFIWRTSRDRRVRDSHQALEGLKFRWDDPPIVDGQAATPGFPIKCRCYPEYVPPT